MTRGEAEAKHIFQTKTPNNHELMAITKVREAFQNMGTLILDTLPDGRYRAIVMSKLEEASMFATKAFTHQ